MKRLGILGLAAGALALLTLDAIAQMGGAVRGGVRGAVVGGAIGGEGASTAGAVIGATRGAMNKEAQVRAQYQTTPAYTNAQLSNFNQVPPEVLVTPATAGAAAKGGETVIKSKDGKPVLGVTYPDDWQQKTGDHHVSAVSKDGHAWAVVATMEGVKDKQAGIEKVKDGIQKSLSDIKYDEPVKTAKGALMVTGTGKTKKSVAVVFAAAVVDSGPGQLAGAVFVVDDNVDEHYKDTVRYICATVRLAKDFGK